MSRWYKLDENNNPVPATIEEIESLLRDGGRRRVGCDTLPDGRMVSTVFLTTPHSGGMFETMVFPKDSWLDDRCERYETWDEAAAGHARIVEEETARGSQADV